MLMNPCLQHQKNQMLGNGSNLGAEESEGEDTDGEEQEGDYTVYECPGLASVSSYFFIPLRIHVLEYNHLLFHKL